MKRPSHIRDQIIANGVKNLHEFGYPDCNAENIITDLVYKQFFVEMLEGNLGQGYDSIINELIKEIKG